MDELDYIRHKPQANIVRGLYAILLRLVGVLAILIILSYLLTQHWDSHKGEAIYPGPTWLYDVNGRHREASEAEFQRGPIKAKRPPFNPNYPDLETGYIPPNNVQAHPTDRSAEEGHQAPAIRTAPALTPPGER